MHAPQILLFRLGSVHRRTEEGSQRVRVTRKVGKAEEKKKQEREKAVEEKKNSIKGKKKDDT